MAWLQTDGLDIEKRHKRPHALVTGGAGFIGSNLVHRLLREGWSVRVLDDLSRPGVEANLQELELIHGSQLEVEIGDVCDSRAVRRVLSGVTDVVHLAGQVSVVASLDDPELDRRVNVGGTINVLNEALRLGAPPSILIASTNKVYGSLRRIPLARSSTRYQPRDPTLRRRGIAENAPLLPDTPYSRSKTIAENFALQHTKSGRLPVIVFRMSCVYGPRQMGHEGQGWVSHFMCQAQEGKQATLFGDGRQVRDLLFIDDLLVVLR